MKRYFILIALVFVAMTVNAQLISKDKPLHFGAGIVIGGVGGYTANKIFGGDRYWTWAGAIGSSLAAGVLKENIDKNEYGGWDNNDILFTVLGGAVSGLALNLILKDKGRRRNGKACSCYAIHYEGSIPLIIDIKLNTTENSSHDLGAYLLAQKIIGEGL